MNQRKDWIKAFNKTWHYEFSLTNKSGKTPDSWILSRPIKLFGILLGYKVKVKNK